MDHTWEFKYIRLPFPHLMKEGDILDTKDEWEPFAIIREDSDNVFVWLKRRLSNDGKEE